MKTFSVLGILALLLVLSSGCSVSDDQRAVNMIQELGGSFKTDTQGQVIEVDLSRTKATDADLALLFALPAIQKLSCSGTRVTGSTLEYLAGLQNLKTLYLDGSELNNEGVAHMAPLSMLETL